MNVQEARTVKHRISVYRDLEDLALQKDREALELHERYVTMAGASAIRYDREPGGSGSGRSKESAYLDLFDAQREADDQAHEYRRQMRDIAAFVKAIDHPDRTIIESAYIFGKRYKEIAEEMGFEISTIHKKIARCLESVPAELARASGLL